MSLMTRSPIRVLGGVQMSGHVSTGEQNVTRGGQMTACFWSGGLTSINPVGVSGAIGSGGGHARIWAGAGRVHSVIPHDALTSGLAVFLYDAAVNSTSGLSLSGQRLVGIVPRTYRGPLAALSGNLQTVYNWQDQIVLDMPFTSGLCVAAGSGAPGCTVSFTPAFQGPFA